VFDGDPGVGKSTLFVDLAGRVTTGTPMPGETGRRPPASVIMLSAEDDIADTIRPRLEAAGADLGRVFIFDHVLDGGESRPPELPRDLPLIHAKILELGAQLVTIDPLMAYFGADIRTGIDHHVRRALHPAKDVAEQTRAAFAVARHLNKGSDSSALYRGGGSIGIGGAARSVLTVGANPNQPGQYVLAATKVNLAPKPPSLAYRLVEDELREVPRILWEGTVDLDADALVVRPERETPERQEAAGFLRDELTKGPARWETLAKLARKEDISEHTLRRAREAMKARGEVDKRQHGQPGEPGTFWEWFLQDH
jgi:putative DNA primase/helicase